MHALHHLAGVTAFCVAFLIGKALVEWRDLWGKRLLFCLRNRKSASNFFLYSGRTIETVSAVGAFIEMVAVLVLAF